MAIYTVQVQQLFTQASINQDPEASHDAERAHRSFKQGIAQLRERITGGDSAKNNIGIGKTKKKQAMPQHWIISVRPKRKQENWRLWDSLWLVLQRRQAHDTGLCYRGVEAGNLVLSDFNTLAQNLRTQLNRIKNQGVNDAKNNAHAITESTKKASMIMLIISLVGIGLGLGIAIYLTHYLGKQLGIDPYLQKRLPWKLPMAI